jgi:DNA-binding NtrC family response regulator
VFNLESVVNIARSSVYDPIQNDEVRSTIERPGFLNAQVARFETKLIRDALEATGWVKLRAAKVLGIPEATLRGKMKKYGLKKPSL